MHPSKKRIKGEISYNDPITNKKNIFTITGGFHSENYLLLNYENSDESNVHFGSAILELSPNPNTLKGLFQGFGRESRSIVSGEILLHKAN